MRPCASTPRTLNPKTIFPVKPERFEELYGSVVGRSSFGSWSKTLTVENGSCAARCELSENTVICKSDALNLSVVAYVRYSGRHLSANQPVTAQVDAPSGALSMVSARVELLARHLNWHDLIRRQDIVTRRVVTFGMTALTLTAQLHAALWRAGDSHRPLMQRTRAAHRNHRNRARSMRWLQKRTA